MHETSLDKIGQWEQQARQLECEGPALAAAMDELQALAMGFIDGLPAAPAYVPALPSSGRHVPTKAGVSSSTTARTLISEQFAAEGVGTVAALRELMGRLALSGIDTAGARYFGFIPGGGVATGAMGDFIAALTNRYSGLYLACPAATEIENELLTWLLTVFGFSRSASWGTLTSGGSLANLTGILAARETRDRQEWGRSPLYMTGQSHHALHRAIKVAGLDLNLIRQIPVDSKFRMDTVALEAALQADLQQGLWPWMVIGNLGTTNTGSIDPLAELLRLKEAYQLWLHLDGAYGGFFMLTEQGRQAFARIHEADSLVLDPHKGLFMPYGLGAVLVKDGQLLRQAFAGQAEYLADLQHDECRSPAEYSPELTRHFRGARLYLSLKAYGSEAFAAALEEKLALTQYAYATLQNMAELECACEPELSVIAFRLHGDDGLTRALLDGILEEGRVFLSSTTLHGKLYIRLAILSFRSHRSDVDECLQAIRRHVLRLLP